MTLRNMLRLKTGWASSDGPHNAVILSSRVRLARNLAGRPFLTRASPKALQEVLGACFQACRGTRELARAAYLKLEELGSVERRFLAERRLASPLLIQEPKSRGIVVGEREVVSAMVNEEDHLRLQAIDSGLCLRSLWPRLDALDTELSETLEFSAHPRWGYLSACPTNAGTGLRVSVLAHLPGLTLAGRANAMLEGLSRLGAAVRGHYGEGSRVLGDFCQISNGPSMGRSEADYVSEMTRAVEGLVARELEACEAVASGPRRGAIEDLVHRSLALLGHARSMSFEETMTHLSSVRLALALGWKVPASLETVNELMVLAQPAHVEMQAERELDPAERDVLRATLLRRRFGDSK